MIFCVLEISSFVRNPIKIFVLIFVFLEFFFLFYRNLEYFFWFHSYGHVLYVISSVCVD